MQARISVITLAAACGLAPAQRYELIDLGASFPDRETYALGTNSAGDRFAGSRSGDLIDAGAGTNPSVFGTMWDSEGVVEFEALSFPNRTRAWLFDVNDRGFLVGQGEEQCGSFGICNKPATSERSRAPTLFSFLGGFLTGTENGLAHEINEQDFAVGEADGDFADPAITCDECAGQPLRTFRPYVVLIDGNNNEPKEFEPLDGLFASASGLNAFNQIVGMSRTNTGDNHAFFANEDDLELTDLETLGGNSSTALDINDNGVVVGWSRNVDGENHAFRLGGVGQQMEDLGTLGGRTSHAKAINNDGVIVGSSWTSDGVVRAFVHADGQMRDLNDLTSGRGDFVLTHAEDISETGVIVGWGMLDGLPRAFALEPVACPADLTMDGELDAKDFFLYLDFFAAGDPAADFEGDGDIDAEDFFLFLDAFAQGC